MAFENSAKKTSEAAEMEARPWITDPADLPSKLNWPEALLNPFGETSRLHFTRVWTGLFFLRLIVFTAPIALSVVLSLSGVQDPGFAPIPIWGFPLIVFATGLMSFVLHIRRLSNAKRSPYWSVLAIFPIILGGLGFVAGLNQAAIDYEVAIEADQLKELGLNPKQMAINFDRRDVYKTLSRDVMLRLYVVHAESGDADTVLAQAIEDAGRSKLVGEILDEIGVDLTQEQSERFSHALDQLKSQLSSNFRFSEFLTQTGRSDIRDYRGSIENRWKRHLPDIDYKTISQRAHAISVAKGLAILCWAIPSLLVMIWTLTWVGRLPNGGGKIQDRFA